MAPSRPIWRWRGARRLLRGTVVGVARPLAPSPGAVLALIDAGELDRARRALRIRPADADASDLRGRLAEAEASRAPVGERPARWRSAVSHYRRALAAGRSDAASAETAYRLGVVLDRLRDRAGAADAFSTAIEHRARVDDVPVEWHTTLGRVEEQRGEVDAARAAYRAALAAEADTPAFLTTMLDLEVRDFVHRRRVGRFVAAELDRIRDRAAAVQPAARPLDRPVFVYWGQGAALAPDLVRACLRELGEVVPPERLHLITETSSRVYVELPARVWKLADTDRAHFSDVLRAALLARYGGTWVDATCFPGPGFLEQTDRRSDQEYFAFRYPEQPARISSWFMTAQSGSYLARMVSAALDLYWTEHQTKLGYYFFHSVFEALYWADPEFRRRWDACPTLPTELPHALQEAMYDPAVSHDLDALLRASFVHKLTWKLRPARVTPDTLLASFLLRVRSEGPGPGWGAARD